MNHTFEITKISLEDDLLASDRIYPKYGLEIFYIDPEEALQSLEKDGIRYETFFIDERSKTKGEFGYIIQDGKAYAFSNERGHFKLEAEYPTIRDAVLTMVAGSLSAVKTSIGFILLHEIFQALEKQNYPKADLDKLLRERENKNSWEFMKVFSAIDQSTPYFQSLDPKTQEKVRVLIAHWAPSLKEYEDYQRKWKEAEEENKRDQRAWEIERESIWNAKGLLEPKSSSDHSEGFVEWVEPSNHLSGSVKNLKDRILEITKIAINEKSFAPERIYSEYGLEIFYIAPEEALEALEKDGINYKDFFIEENNLTKEEWGYTIRNGKAYSFSHQKGVLNLEDEFPTIREAVLGCVKRDLELVKVSIGFLFLDRILPSLRDQNYPKAELDKLLKEKAGKNSREFIKVFSAIDRNAPYFQKLDPITQSRVLFLITYWLPILKESEGRQQNEGFFKKAAKSNVSSFLKAVFPKIKK